MIQNLKLLFSNTQSRVVGMVFAVNSFMFGSWITHLPEIKEKLHISDGTLGLALLGVPLGSIVAMPFMGWVIHRLGSGKTTWLYGLLFCIISSLPVMASHYFLFIGALILVGVSTGSMDVAMNAAAAAVEKKSSINIMSGCHGMWSVGGMVGAAAASLIVGYKISPSLHILALAVLFILLLLFLQPVLLSIHDEKPEEVVVFSLPTGPLIGLAAAGFCIMMGEGAVYDWNAIYLKDTLKANAFYSGLGYAGFSMTMAVGRFYGDRLIHDWGARKMVITGAVISFTGILIALVIRQPLVVIAGFTLAGLGYSCLVPSIYISASRMPGGSAGSNLAGVAGLGYFGLLAGPPLIGMIAEHAGLTTALGVVLLLMIIVVGMAGKIRFEK